jgi:hypothetical protein
MRRPRRQRTTRSHAVADRKKWGAQTGCRSRRPVPAARAMRTTAPVRRPRSGKSSKPASVGYRLSVRGRITRANVKLYQLQDWRRGRVQSDLAPRTLFRLVAATKSALAQTGGNSLQDQTEKNPDGCIPESEVLNCACFVTLLYRERGLPVFPGVPPLMGCGRFPTSSIHDRS